MKSIAFFLLGCCMSWVSAAEIRPFNASSLSAIQAERLGRPFILAFWSATCTHCPQELRTLGQLARRYPKLEVVLVAADSPDLSPQLQELARGYGLEKQAQWVFADEQTERLRFAIDKRWYGELPRTYFYNAQHQREGRSGVIPTEQLERWVQDQTGNK